MRQLLRPVWFLLALAFIVEAWLWDHVAPVIARLVAMIPFQRLKAWLARRIMALSPAASLLVFLVPVVVLLPLKFVALWLFAREAWLMAVGVLLFAKVAGVGITAFVFDLTRPKLLQMRWFAWLYERVMYWRGRALEFLAPYRARLHAMITSLRSRASPRILRLVTRWRHYVRTRSGH